MDLHEKRKHHRIELKYPISIAFADRIAPAQLLDLSKGGARVSFSLDDAFEGHRVELQFRVPDRMTLSVTCTVRRTRQEKGTVELGLEFLSNDAEMQAQLTHLMESFLQGTDSTPYPRVSKRLPVSFADLSDLEMTLEHISLGGLAMTVEKELPLYEEIELSIPNLAGEELLVVRGKVVHQYPLENTGYFRVGVEFDDLPSASKKCLQALMYEILELGAA